MRNSNFLSKLTVPFLKGGGRRLLLTVLALGLAVCGSARAQEEVTETDGPAVSEDSELKITGTFPVNGGQEVFLTSGIELTFNTENVGKDALEEAVSIFPETEFYVASGDDSNTLVICPYEPYEPETLYRVTVREGLTSADGLKLQSDFGFSFTTCGEDLQTYYDGTVLAPAGQGAVVNALTDELPTAFLMVQEDLAGNYSGGRPEAQVTLYRFEEDKDFANALVQKIRNGNSRRESEEPDPSGGKGIREEASFTIKAEEITDNPYWWWNYREYVLTFPEALPEGKYLARLDIPVQTKHQDITVTKYLLVQSTELSGFLMASGESTVAWLHNGITGEALEGAKISLYRSFDYRHGETGADGTAQLIQDKAPVKMDLPGMQSSAWLMDGSRILYMEAGGHSFIESVSDAVLFNNGVGYYGGYYGGTNREYYTYLYTDRQIYSTTDEVHFYGVVKARSEGTELPKTLKVRLQEGWWSGDEVTEVEVSPDEKGYFTGVISFEDQKAASYCYLGLLDENDGWLSQSESFSIEDFVKPTYTYEIGTDKPVYVLGSEGDREAVIDIRVSYFDETPAAGFSLAEEWSSTGLTPGQGILTADGQGRIADHVAFTAGHFPNTWRPQSAQVSYESADVEDEKLYMNQELMIIPRDVMLYAENDSENETLKVYTYAIDASGIKERADLYERENLKGAGLSAEVSGTLYKCWYEKISDGIRYDYIYKQSYEDYHYEYHEDAVERCVINTADGEGSWSYHIEQDEENPACYYMKLSVKDSAGRSVDCTAGLSYRSLSKYISYSSRETVYSLKPIEEEQAPEDAGTWAWYMPYEHKFSENAPAEFVLVRNDEEFELPEGGELLSASLLRGFSNIEAGKDTRRSVDFSEELLPNYYMLGAYFDGRNTWPLRYTPMTFDYETRRLEMTVSGAEEKKKPGETVSVTVAVSRPESGKEVPEGTPVILSVVDEAIFALREQEIRVLQQLYGQFSISCSTYSTANTLMPSTDSTSGMKYAVEEEMAETAAAPTADAMAAGAMAGEEHIRSDFRDTACFLVSRTDAEGKAVFTFTLPDNMTSWRLSAVTVTDDIWAGSTVDHLICSVPYYTVPVLNDIMLAGESFAIGLRSAGTLEDAGTCSYEVSVRRAGEDEVICSGSAVGESLRDYTSVTLDLPGEGSYIVRIKGSCGDYTDISEYPFEVVRSGLEAYASKSGPISEMTEIHPLRYPVEAFIYDKDAYVYNAVLSRLLCSRDIRADERLGAYYAMTVLSQSGSAYFEDMLKDHDIKDLGYIFPLFKYAKNDAEISALAYLAVPELLASRPVRGIKPSDISVDIDSLYTGSPYAAYLLQALAGEAFSEDVEELLAQEALAFRDRIYLMAALFTAGSEDAAREAFEKYALPYLKSSEAVSGEVVYYLNVDEKTTVQDDTAAALIMASLLHREEARGMALYLLEKPSDKNIYPLEEVLYLKNCEEKDAEGCIVRYTLDGETREETLKRGRRICLNLQKKALDELKLETVSGDPWVTMFYIAGMDELTDESTMKLTAEVTTDKESYKVGDEAKITIKPGIGSLDPSIGCSTMVLDVYIPSGMRFERYTPATVNNWYWHLVSREGQRLRFLVYDGSLSGRGFFAPVTFTATCVTPGTYIVEKAYLSSNHYDTWGLSERGSVTITEE